MGKKNRSKQYSYSIENKTDSQNLNSNNYLNKQNDNDVFDNPMTRAALAALSEEDKARYKEIGEHMYGRINYEDGKSLNNMDSPMAEAVAYIETQLRSGLHPSMMEDKEKVLIADVYGENWYLKWGYVAEDLNSIFTVKQKML